MPGGRAPNQQDMLEAASISYCLQFSSFSDVSDPQKAVSFMVEVNAQLTRQLEFLKLDQVGAGGGLGLAAATCQ